MRCRPLFFAFAAAVFGEARSVTTGRDLTPVGYARLLCRREHLLRITTLQASPNPLNRKLFYPRSFTPLLEASRGRGFRNDEVLVGLAAGFEFHFVLVQGELDGRVDRD